MLPVIKPPKSLSKGAQKQWKELQIDFDITDKHGLLLLQTAFEAYDRMKQCQEIIKKEGMQVLDRFGQQKAHSLCIVERDSRTSMLAAFKALNLEFEPVHTRNGKPEGKR